MLRVYLAAPFELQSSARLLETQLGRHGIACTSRWLRAGPTNVELWADYCRDDVARADVFVAVNPKSFADKGTGGRHVEFGMALILHKPLVIYGVKSNLFHEVKRAVVVPDEGGDLPRAIRHVAAIAGLQLAEV